MKITILGCGPSGGVPLVGNLWGECDPNNPKNRRSRASILVEEGETTILVDTSTDLREQLLRHNIQKVDAVLFTHAHADHVHGIDDMRGLNLLMQKDIPAYAHADTLADLQHKYGYIFQPNDKPYVYRPALLPNIIEEGEPFEIGPLTITPIPVKHGRMTTLAYKFNNTVYSPDISGIIEGTEHHYQNLDLWITDALRPQPHPSHAHLERTLEWITHYKPRQAYLTHMTKELDYEALSQELPEGVGVCFDGMEIK